MRIATALLACLALAACKGEQKKETGGTAQGEILPGSASDAMLPLDTVKSQAPLAPKAEGGAKPDAKAGAKAADATDTADKSDAAPAAGEGEAATPDKSGDQ